MPDTESNIIIYNTIDDKASVALMEQHESHPRNRLMASVFYLAGFIEAWGRGYEKIREAFKAEKFEMPTLEEVRGGIMVTMKREIFLLLQNKEEVDSTTSITEKTDSTTQKTTQKILEAIKLDPFITIERLCEICGLTRDGLNWNIRKMKNENIIRRVGPDKGGYWEILK